MANKKTFTAAQLAVINSMIEAKLDNKAAFRAATTGKLGPADKRDLVMQHKDRLGTMPDARLAKELGVSCGHVAAIRRELGISTWSSRGGPNFHLADLNVKAVKALRDAGFNQMRMAEVLVISQPQVSRILKKLSEEEKEQENK